MGALAASADARFALGFGVALLLATSLAMPALDGAPYASGSTSYTPDKAERYYGRRAPLVAFRVIRLAALTAAFNAKLFLDWRLGNLEKNEKYRAAEALVLCTQLGPTFIKLGQALSIRTDLIPEAYALELRALQDAVPPFDSEQAREIMRAELNVADLSTVFKKISDKPIASASIGQVYKGTLKDGREVAVKVQRPNILSEIALDLYILRFLTPLQVSKYLSKRPPPETVSRTPSGTHCTYC
jgi:predicted unusual protein kinase regulating ubiquinone biosynthesis (AarF/ABC1/UbiB family)